MDGSDEARNLGMMEPKPKSFVCLRLSQRFAFMSDDIVSPLPELPARATQRPCCPRCEARSKVQRIVCARPGFEHWTLRCTKCGTIHEAQVQTDAIKANAQGWLDSELVPPK